MPVQQSEIDERFSKVKVEKNSLNSNYSALFYFSKDNFLHGVKEVENRQKTDCCGLGSKRNILSSEIGEKENKDDCRCLSQWK